MHQWWIPEIFIYYNYYKTFLKKSSTCLLERKMLVCKVPGSSKYSGVPRFLNLIVYIDHVKIILTLVPVPFYQICEHTYNTNKNGYSISWYVEWIHHEAAICYAPSLTRWPGHNLHRRPSRTVTSTTQPAVKNIWMFTKSVHKKRQMTM